MFGGGALPLPPFFRDILAFLKLAFFGSGFRLIFALILILYLP